MSEHLKYSIEFPIQSSVSVLYKRLSTPSGLSEWFADNVNMKDKTYTFIWDETEQSANILKKKNNSFIRFHWLENPKEIYFEFLIQVDEMTSDVSLIISDFAEGEDDKEEQILLWEEQVNSLKRAIGS